MHNQRKAVVTVLGHDRKGIIAQVSRVLYEADVNILDLSQTIVSGLFNMVMLVDITEPSCSFEDLVIMLNSLGERLGLQIRIQRNEIFDAMHQI